jgi:glycosyltransferase involved in cell wall biosynthesis
MNFCFVFGLEPWLLPPALEMIAVLRSNGHQVTIIYAQYQGTPANKADFDMSIEHIVVSKQSGYKRLLQHQFISKAVQNIKSKGVIDTYIACDILALQALVGIKGILKGYWAFEITYKPLKFKPSMDYFRALSFPAWISRLNFFMAPSVSRIKHITDRISSNIPHEVLYNCRQYIPAKTMEGLPLHKNAPLKLVYTGMISKDQYIEEIIDAIAFLDIPVTLTLAGPCAPAYQANLQERIASNNKLKESVHLIGRVERMAAYELLAQSDIGFVFYNEQDLTIDPAPNKLSDYIAANLWIIGGSQPYIKYWLEERGAGISIPSITPQYIANAITQIATSGNFADKNRLADIYKNELNMNVQSEKLIKLVELSKVRKA